MMSTHMTRSMSLGHRQQAPACPSSFFARKPVSLRASRCRQIPATRRGWVDDAASYYYSGPQASSSKQGKAHKQQKASKHRGRVQSLVAEVESLVERLDQGLLDPMTQPVTTGLLRSYSSSSTSSTTSSGSSSSSESDSDGEHQQRHRGGSAAAPLDTTFFDRQQQQLLERIYAGSLAEPSGASTTPGAAAPAPRTISSASSPTAPAAQPPVASNVVSRSSSGVLERPPRGSTSGSVMPRPAAAPAGRVEVCMGKACARKGAAALLADFQAAAAAPGAAGVHLQVVPCGKCMGKCKLAPNVRVATTGGRSVLHSGVTTASARAILQNDFIAQADFFDFV